MTARFDNRIWHSRREFLSAIAATTLLAAHKSAAQVGDLSELSIAEASILIRTRALSPVDLTRAYLERIERLNARVNAYITVSAGLALEQAGRLEAELAAGRWRGPLHGIPIALKDNIDTAGIRTTAASAVLQNRVPIQDAEVYRRLKEAGAVLLGKLNMHEFAYGGTSAITHFGPVRNPWNLDYIPGGSSGGSAAAVAAGLCAAAFGTDTLASIRLPAAYCGVVGLKATHGLASIRGIIPVSESLDHVGPLTKTVGDSALLLQAIAGFDPLDPVSIDASLPSYAQAVTRRVSSLRIGLPRETYFESLDPEIDSAVQTAVEVLTQLAGGARGVDLPEAPDFEPLLAEANVHHQQYLEDPANRALYHPATLERIVAAGGFSVEQYVNSRRELAFARSAISAVFDQVDLVVTPTTPVMPTTIENAEIPDSATGAESTVRNTAPFNLFGIPTISIPCGFSRLGLPIGIQISGPRLGELPMLSLAHAYEQATRWRLDLPPLA
jgi:aspartyl-tRNA(Asn)/glutamyl-tRNA(Gln) amidotransferase subunit A